MVSVILPMYNSENTIVDALNSIKDQTAIESILEIIVINDGSTDNSLNIVEEYRRTWSSLPITVIDKPNGGVSSARNAGLREAKGKFIALLDSDDVWLPKKIELQLKVLHDNPDIDFLGCNNSGKPLKILWKKVDKLYKANIKDLCIKCFPSTPAAIFKRSLIDEIGYFDENQKYGEDMNYFNKICVDYNYYHLPEYLVYIGGGKPQFGYSGLSSNLKGMHYGNLKNIKELKDNKSISLGFYVFIYFFYWIKHFRRIIITNLRRKNNFISNLVLKYGKVW